MPEVINVLQTLAKSLSGEASALAFVLMTFVVLVLIFIQTGKKMSSDVKETVSKFQDHVEQNHIRFEKMNEQSSLRYEALTNAVLQMANDTNKAIAGLEKAVRDLQEKLRICQSSDNDCRNYNSRS